jgi:hypothetical protein
METVTAPVVLIDRYLACWNEADPARRRALIDETFATSATYADPVLTGAGREGIDAMIAGFQAQYPNHTFSGGEADGDSAFTWSLAAPDGTVLIRGRDEYTLAEDGTFATIAGTFLDQ